MDGDWHNLGGAPRRSRKSPWLCNPSCGSTNISEEAWAAEWIEALLAREGVTIMPEAKKHVWSGRHLFGFGSGHGTHPPA
jgi:type IV secretory pathway VirB4 component